MHEPTLMELFANPETIHSLTTGEKLVGSLVTTGMGMGITFGILILLCFIIMLMTKVLGIADNKKKKVQEAPAAAAPAPVVPAVPEPEENLMDDEELVAVIMAAITAAQGPGKQNNLYIRKIRRTSDDTPAWSRAGNKDSFSNRM